MPALLREVTTASVALELLGPYWLLDTIGQGRTGSVHRACLRRDGKPDKLIALKRIAPELSKDPRFAQRFLEVMARAAQVVHPALCAIEDIDRTEEGGLYAALELVAGKNLGQIAAALSAQGDSMPPWLLAYVGNQVADALTAAHRALSSGVPAPVFHGELGPDHILVGYDGSVRLIGLGAHALSSVLAQASPRMAYRAPELNQGGSCTAQADVFSLGACMYELLTGSPAGTARDERFNGHRQESQITKVIPRALEPIVSRALADRPEERFESAIELGRALRRWSSLQSLHGDAASLAVFMRKLFAASCEEEAGLVVQALDRIPSDTSGALPLKPASFAPPKAIDAPLEQTPARGILMSELAAQMADNAKPADAPPESMRVPKGAAKPPAWEDQTPAQISISVSEDEDEAEPEPVPAVDAQDAIPTLRPVAPAPAFTPAAAFTPALALTPAPETRWRLWIALASIALGVVLAATAWMPRGGSPVRSSLQVQTRPIGAEVFVRGERVGTTPLRAVQLPAGSAKLELRKPGFEPVLRALTLAPNQLVDLQVDLVAQAELATPEPDPVAAPALEVPTSPASPAASSRGRALPSRPFVPRPAAPAALHASGDPLAAGEPSDPSAPSMADDLETGSSAVSSAAVPATQAAGGSDGSATSIAHISPTAEPQPVAQAKTSVAPAAKSNNPAAGPSRPAQLIERIEPRFPARAKRSGITSGNVTVELTIDASGAVSHAQVVDADPQGVFEDAALRAAEKWRYQPQLSAGKPVPSRQRVKFRFQ